MAEIRWNAAVAMARMDAGAARGVARWGEHVLQQSRAIVPIDEAVLEHSGQVSTDLARAIAHVSYDTPYAVRQHEEMNYRHAPGRSAKYLERPLNASHQAGLAILAAEVRRALGAS